MDLIKYDYKNKVKYCRECNSTELKTDLIRQETYCFKCGLVLKNNQFLTILEKENQQKERLKEAESSKKW